ncbi:MAG TPA: hypothetical protein VFA55_10350 [Candidatus Kapabacteria bacterium]|nr:hypothetical protein [Candidatus Kapabacteria bacterium]
MTKAEELFHKLAQELPDAKESKMFGALCIKAPNGKSGAMFWEECIVVKLTGSDGEKALALKGAHLFTPMANRPMKEWVQIPFAHSTKWKYYAAISMDAVKAIKKEKPAVKKKK